MSAAAGLRGFVVVASIVAAGLVAVVPTLSVVLMTSRGEARRERAARLGGRFARRALPLLGPTFVKLGQILSTRPDVLHHAAIAELRRLQDRLPPARFPAILAVLKTEFGEAPEARFAEFDREPVAAGSVAQVHRAVLHDGTEVAVKVLRPGVRDRIEADATVLLSLARLANRIPACRDARPIELMQQFLDAIRQQADLALEAKNYDAFAANFRSVPDIVFPRVYREHSTGRVLTMDFLRGTKVDELPEERRIRCGAQVRRAFFKMCFEDAFVHADLHPGNMLLTDRGELALFDVGLVTRLDMEFFFQFIDFTASLTLRNARVFVGHFRRFHPYLEDRCDWGELEDDLADVIGRFAGRSTAEIEYADFNREIFRVFRKHHVQPVPEITMMLVASMTVEGIGKFLDPDRNQLEEIGKHIFVDRLRATAAVESFGPPTHPSVVC